MTAPDLPHSWTTLAGISNGLRRHATESSIQGGAVHLEHAGHLAGGGALLEQALRQGDLLCAQLGGPAEAHAALLGRDPSRTCALLDQCAFELGDAGKDGEHHPSGRTGRVGPRLAERAQPGPGLAQLLGDLEQVAGRAGQAVETLDHDDVALAYLLEQAVQLR